MAIIGNVNANNNSGWLFTPAPALASGSVAPLALTSVSASAAAVAASSGSLASVALTAATGFASLPYNTGLGVIGPLALTAVDSASATGGAEPAPSLAIVATTAPAGSALQLPFDTNTNAGGNSGWVYATRPPGAATNAQPSPLNLVALDASVFVSNSASALGDFGVSALVPMDGSATGTNNYFAYGDLTSLALEAVTGSAVEVIDAAANGIHASLGLIAPNGTGFFVRKDHNVDDGNNTGWAFLAAPIVVSALPSNLFFGCNF
jgi:hypothetical protein